MNDVFIATKTNRARAVGPNANSGCVVDEGPNTWKPLWACGYFLWVNTVTEYLKQAAMSNQEVANNENRSWLRLGAVFCDLRSPEQLSRQSPTIPIVDLFAGHRDGRSFCTTGTETRNAHILRTSPQETQHIVDSVDILVCARFLHRS